MERVLPVDFGGLPEALAIQLASDVRRFVLPQRGVLFLRLRIDLEAGPRLRVGRSERCPPLGRTDILIGTASNVRIATPPPVQARVLVGAEGQSLAVAMMGSTDNPGLDSSMQGSLNTRKWTPGLVDGIPTEMEFTTTIRFRSR